MNNERIKDEMIVKIESIVKELLAENLNNEAKVNKKPAARRIIAELDKVIEDETKEN